ncbi:MAG: hypothetical protein M9894_03265 [Planctomycetes bacterium]|nr:hypothetical protein [Planctomycetota bacterium]
MDRRAVTCPYCAEAVAGDCLKCPHCGEGLVDRDDHVAALRATAPDPALAARVGEWPDESLVRALRDHPAEYAPEQRRAVLDEVLRRGLPVPARRRPQATVVGKLVSTGGLVLVLFVFLKVVVHLVLR